MSQNGRDWIGIASIVAGTVIFSYTAWWYIALDDPQLYFWDSLPLALGFGTRQRCCSWHRYRRRLKVC
ncbi:MAG: hypothetical protein IPK02_10355 [Candidatus Accumulibacter sp.]|uniref:Uncharacterized protein n=1 Tax=Candidatus Accumulibacter affinis TaxID=2954384 RepID=A0A935T9M2_9PROT|nr:hypothetical protein [Candidatus Accumulibacter affinis]